MQTKYFFSTRKTFIDQWPRAKKEILTIMYNILNFPNYKKMKSDFEKRKTSVLITPRVPEKW